MRCNCSKSHIVFSFVLVRRRSFVENDSHSPALSIIISHVQLFLLFEAVVGAVGVCFISGFQWCFRGDQ